MLKSVYLGFRKVKEQRVTVVEFEMYNRSGDGVGCLEVKVGANAEMRDYRIPEIGVFSLADDTAPLR